MASVTRRKCFQHLFQHLFNVVKQCWTILKGGCADICFNINWWWRRRKAYIFVKERPDVPHLYYIFLELTVFTLIECSITTLLTTIAFDWGRKPLYLEKNPGLYPVSKILLSYLIGYFWKRLINSGTIRGTEFLCSFWRRTHGYSVEFTSGSISSSKLLLPRTAGLELYIKHITWNSQDEIAWELPIP